MSQPFAGPVVARPSDPNIPQQPVFTTWCVGWGAYDVPRLHDIVDSEDDELGWEQVKGFRQLAILLLDHYARLRVHESRVTNAWQGPAAQAFLSQLDRFAAALYSDAYCAATTAKALDGIMNAYADARRRIIDLNNAWYDVTRDWMPEWWDHAAAKLNAEAQAVMFQTDQEVGEYRTKIIIPRSAHSSLDEVHVDIESGDEGPYGPSGQSKWHVPPVPGYGPVINGSPGADSANEGEGLASMPRPIDAGPRQPISMLPIPPGGPYVPHGGAYILPGPGVGRGGYVVPMPRQNGPGVATRSSIGGISSSGFSMMPAPMAIPPNDRGQGGHAPLYRRGNTQWYVEKGGPPVINAIPEDVVIPGLPSRRQQEAFEDWFAELAYPWRSSNGDHKSEPQIVLRRTPI